MSLPNELHPLQLAASSGGYEIEQSLRFNSADSAYLNRTPGSSGSTTTWTISTWVKRASLGVAQMIWSAGTSGVTYLTFNADDTLKLRNSTVEYTTNWKFRDASAWYHIVVKWDTTNGTQINRAIIYVNGVALGAGDYSTYDKATPSEASTWNTNVAHNLGRYAYNGTFYLSGYLAEVNFIDGSALDPTDFAEFDDNGVWRPIKYTGTYTGNSFYLKFDAADVDGDSSGLGNDFTANNFTTSGTGTDVMSDTPTTNWCTLNPVDVSNGGFGLRPNALSNGNLVDSSTSNALAKGTLAVNSGKWYFEYTGWTSTSFRMGVALVPSTSSPFSNTDLKLLNYNGQYQSNAPTGTAGGTTYGGSISSTDIIGVAVDMDNRTIAWSKNGQYGDGSGNWDETYANASKISLESTGGVTPCCLNGSTTASAQTFNFGQRDFAYTPPTGYKALNTSNLSAPSIKDGDEYFNTYLGPGEGMLDTSSRITADPGNLSNSYFLGSNIDDPGNFNKGGPNAGLGNRAIYGTTYSGFYNNGNVASSNTPTYNNGYIEFATALNLSGNCYVYWGNTSAGNGSELGAAIRVTYGDGTTATSQLGKTIDYPTGNWTVGNFTFDKRYIGRYALNNTKTLKKVEISSSMSGRYGAHIAAIVIDDDPEIDLGTLTISVEDGSKFTVGDDVYKSTDSFISGTVTAVSGNNVTIRTSEGFIDDTDRNIDWSEDWPDAELVHRDSATQITDTDYELVWIKDRDNSNDHQLLDRVRGTNKVLESNTTDSERTYSAPSGYSVAWAWRTGAGSGSSNTDGSINSTVSANPSAGFSIVSYTGTGANATVGHGLGVAPKFFFGRNRNDTSGLLDWIVYHESVGNTARLKLNTPGSTSTSSTFFQNTSPSSTVITIGTSNDINKLNGTYVLYCFAEVEGYSKFGSYTGNGNADGPFIATSFSPSWILFKNTNDNLASWHIFDTSRSDANGNNPLDRAVFPNNSNAEEAPSGSSSYVDALSNGFKIRSSTGSVNGNGNTHIFMAFASNPFGGSGVSPATAR